MEEIDENFDIDETDEKSGLINSQMHKWLDLKPNKNDIKNINDIQEKKWVCLSKFIAKSYDYTQQ